MSAKLLAPNAPEPSEKNRSSEDSDQWIKSPTSYNFVSTNTAITTINGSESIDTEFIKY